MTMTDNMIETLETVRDCFSELCQHPAFEGDAVEFNEGGIAFEASCAVRTVLADIEPDSRTLAEIAETAVYDATFTAAIEAARSTAGDIQPGGYRNAMVSSVAMLAADRLVEKMHDAAIAAATDAIDEFKGKD